MYGAFGERTLLQDSSEILHFIKSKESVAVLVKTLHHLRHFSCIENLVSSFLLEELRQLDLGYLLCSRVSQCAATACFSCATSFSNEHGAKL